MPKSLLHPFGDLCHIVQQRYANNDRLCLALVTADNGEPYCVATTNVPEVILGENEVVVKDYSENKGIAKLLVHADIADFTGRFANHNHDMPILRIKPAVLAEYLA